MHEPHFRLDHNVVSRLAAVRPRLPVASDAGVDEGGVESGEGGVVERVFGEGLGEIVFDEDVTLLGEGVKDGNAGGVLEGEGEGFFIAVYLVNRM